MQGVNPCARRSTKNVVSFICSDFFGNARVVASPPNSDSHVSSPPLRDVAHSVPASSDPHVRRPARGPLQTAKRVWSYRRATKHKPEHRVRMKSLVRAGKRVTRATLSPCLSRNEDARTAHWTFVEGFSCGISANCRRGGEIISRANKKQIACLLRIHVAPECACLVAMGRVDENWLHCVRGA